MLVLYVAAAAFSPGGGLAGAGAGLTPPPFAEAASLLRGQRGAVAVCADESLAAEAGAVVLPAIRLHHHFPELSVGPTILRPAAFAYLGAVEGEAMAAFVARHARDQVVDANDAVTLLREIGASDDAGARSA